MKTLILIGTLLKESGHILRDRRWLLTSMAALFLVVAWVIEPYEDGWMLALRSDGEGFARWVAEFLSEWGDFPKGPVYLAVGLLIVGLIGNKPKLKRIAITCLLGGALAGVVVNVFRPSLGRPRPYAHVQDGLYGPSMQHRYNGMPSGHTAAAFGYSTALAVAYPPAGVPAMLFATSVGWSRMEVNRHRPTDVVIGALIGLHYGLVVGWAARRKRVWDTS